MEQNAKNHARYIPLWHIVTTLVILAILGWGIVLFMDHHRQAHLLGAAMIMIAFVLGMIWAYARYFALKAHDKAIRAEENFRHYLLTGKTLDKELRMSQIVALRFASDEEMPALAKRAVAEKMTSKQIKLAIKDWKPDYNRV